MTPFYFGMLAVAMLGAYFIARNFSGGLQVSQSNVLLQSNRAVQERAAALYRHHYAEAQRVAFTAGVADMAAAEDSNALQPILQSLLSLSGLDSVIVTDARGIEIVGVFRNDAEASEAFTISEGADLTTEPAAINAVDPDGENASAFLSTPDGVMLYTGMPIRVDDEIVGAVLVGQSIESVLEELKGSAIADLSLYGPDASLLQTTLDLNTVEPPLQVLPDIFTQVFGRADAVPVENMRLGGVPYNVAYSPFQFGTTTLGALGVFIPDDLPFITETGRQLTAIGAAIVVGVGVTLGFTLISGISGRAGQVAEVATHLASGNRSARTGMHPTDEINAVGHALDTYADAVQEQHDTLQHALRRQRREINHLFLIFESMPDGVVVQDLDGRVVVMNEEARNLLGSQRVFRSAGLHELQELVNFTLGPALAPGLYALGDPHRIHLDEKVLSAQAGAVMTATEHRLGTVVIMRDITDEVRKEREREVMLERLAEEIQQPLSMIGRAASSGSVNLIDVFAKEITRQSVALQKMIMDMRELASADLLSVQRRQRPLSLETLIWAVANEWRQIAQANGLKLHVLIEKQGLFVLGDEKRLRWAIGNIVDNAIKYTLPGGALTLEIKSETDGMANIRIRDNGVGVAEPDRALIFTRFYRGTPVTSDGQVIRVPGMGQGLFVAKQIVDSHGGSIRMKSSQRVGTAVFIRLPLTAAVGLEVPRMDDMDGETQQLAESLLVDIDENLEQ